MGFHNFRIRIFSEEDHLTVTEFRHLHTHWIIRVQNPDAIWQNYINLGTHNAKDLIFVIDGILRKICFRVDIDDNAYLAAIVSQAFN